MIAFGPVPSRRLGASLGINNIPPKACSYSCRYCQVGPTHRQEIEPRPFYSPARIRDAVQAKLTAARKAGESVDYLTFVADGEPTLDVNLGAAIDLLRPLGVKIAVISNASLLWRKQVRQRLGKADWVSLKVDAVEQTTWRRIDRPHKALRLDSVLGGIRAFSRQFTGILATETMLVAGVNDHETSVAAVADFLATLAPSKPYLAVPTRPTAATNSGPPSEEVINRSFQVMAFRLSDVELLTGYEGSAFASTGSFDEDLLNITAVHPMRKDAVQALAQHAGADWSAVVRLINAGRLKETAYRGQLFYLRKSPRIR